MAYASSVHKAGGTRSAASPADDTVRLVASRRRAAVVARRTPAQKTPHVTELTPVERAVQRHAAERQKPPHQALSGTAHDIREPSPSSVPATHSEEVEARFGPAHDALQAHGLTLGRHPFFEAMEGFNSGAAWVLNRAGYETPPVYRIGRPTDSKGVSVNAYVPSGGFIALQIGTFNLFTDDAYRSGVRADYGPEFPAETAPTLTPRQYFECIGVEETLHYLQDGRVADLASIPPPNALIAAKQHAGIRYMLQPHELEAVKWIGDFLRERYGTNPFDALETFLRSRADGEPPG